MFKLNTSLATAVLAAFMASPAAAQTGDAYTYDCSNCRCNAVGHLPNIAIGSTTNCFPITSQILALGLTANLGGEYSRARYTSCNVYSDGNCQTHVQTVGVHSSQSWGCTALQQAEGSIKCSYG